MELQFGTPPKPTRQQGQNWDAIKEALKEHYETASANGDQPSMDQYALLGSDLGQFTAQTARQHGLETVFNPARSEPDENGKTKALKKGEVWVRFNPNYSYSPRKAKASTTETPAEPKRKVKDTPQA